MASITTKYTTTSKGEGRIVAKGQGKQRTVPYDHSANPERNHGAAAGELAKALGLQWHDGIVHVGFSDGSHRFNF